MKMRSFFYAIVVAYCSTLPVSATDYSFPSQLAQDKAEHPSTWRAWAKSYPIDPAIQTDLQSILEDLAKKMEVPDVSLRIAEANTLNSMLPARLDFTGPGFTYAVEFFGMFPSIILGEDFIHSCDKRQLEAAIAHEMAHIKNNDFTKRLVVSLCFVATTWYLLKRTSVSEAIKRALFLVPLGCVLAYAFKKQEQEADAQAQVHLGYRS